jgi:hypothetical protein
MKGRHQPGEEEASARVPFQAATNLRISRPSK